MSINFEAVDVARTKIKEQLDIPTYYTDYVDREVDLSSYNRDCCPLHDENSPSFFYFSDSEKFHCFGCDKTGDVTELHYQIQLRLNPTYTRTKAVLDLSKLYQIDIPNIFKAVTLEDKPTNKFKSTKLPFKRKEELVKPTKKLKSEAEHLLADYKHLAPTADYMQQVARFDAILFLDGSVEADLTAFMHALSTSIAKITPTHTTHSRKDDFIENT